MGVRLLAVSYQGHFELEADVFVSPPTAQGRFRIIAFGEPGNDLQGGSGSMEWEVWSSPGMFLEILPPYATSFVF